MNPFVIGALVVAVWAYLRNGAANAFPILNFGQPAKGVTTSFQAPTTTASTSVAPATQPQVQPSASGSGVPAYAPQSQNIWNPNAPAYGRFYAPGQFGSAPLQPRTQPAPANCGCGCAPSSSCSSCKSAGRGNCMSASPSTGPVIAGGNVSSQAAQAATIAHLNQFGDANRFQVYLQQSMDMDTVEGGVPAGQVRSNYQPQ